VVLKRRGHGGHGAWALNGVWVCLVLGKRLTETSVEAKFINDKSHPIRGNPGNVYEPCRWETDGFSGGQGML
jgi:hypothetical protein